MLFVRCYVCDEMTDNHNVTPDTSPEMEVILTVSQVKAITKLVESNFDYDNMTPFGKHLLQDAYTTLMEQLVGPLER